MTTLVRKPTAFLAREGTLAFKEQPPLFWRVTSPLEFSLASEGRSEVGEQGETVGPVAALEEESVSVQRAHERRVAALEENEVTIQQAHDDRVNLITTIGLKANAATQRDLDAQVAGLEEGAAAALRNHETQVAGMEEEALAMQLALESRVQSLQVGTSSSKIILLS